MIVPLMSEVREELKQQGITGCARWTYWIQREYEMATTLHVEWRKRTIDGEVKNMKFH